VSQTNVIFGGIVLAFVVYVVMRGEAPAYLSLFKHDKPGANAMPSADPFGGGGSFGGAGSTGSWGDAINSLQGAGDLMGNFA
jgi:uncharacterized membrane protein YgcG